MAQTSVSIRMDENLKKEFEKFCDETGMNITTAVNIFAKTVVREQRIPFEIKTDQFYSNKNIEYLTKIISEIKNGTANLVEHNLIEDNKNVVLMSLEQYNSIMKTVRNAEYLTKIDMSIEQLENRKGKMHELIEDDLIDETIKTKNTM